MAAMASATSSMAADYEGQLQQLKHANEGLLKQVQQMAGDQSKARATIHRLYEIVTSRTARDAEAQFCRQLLEALSDSPWPMPNSVNPSTVGSIGDPKTIPTS